MIPQAQPHAHICSARDLKVIGMEIRTAPTWPDMGGVSRGKSHCGLFKEIRRGATVEAKRYLLIIGVLHQSKVW
jgi:hypothetical protein